MCCCLRFVDVVHRYHGYLFSWAIIYTFWYHPTDGTRGHLVGFFYLFLLLVQSAVTFTPVHVRRGWTLLLELLVLPTVCSWRWSNRTDSGPCSALALLRSSYSRRCMAWAGACASAPSSVWHEVLRIPVLDYGVVLLLYGVFLVVNRVVGGKETSVS